MAQSKRPVCGHCGKAYGQRAVDSEQVRWPVGEQMPEYRGNGVVVKTGEPYRTTSRAALAAAVAATSNPEIRARAEADVAKMPEQSYMVTTRWIWDGESWWGGYKPFCTLRCALEFARKAFAAGYRPRGGAK